MTSTAPADFPYIVVERLVDSIRQEIPPVTMTDGDQPIDVNVKASPLDPMDPSPTIAIYPIDWQPMEYEIGSGFSGEATISRYNYSVDVLVQHSDQAEGGRVHGELSKRVRNLIMRNSVVRDSLSGLSVASEGIERVSRWGITAQAFASQEIQGSMHFASAIQMYVETELLGPV